MIWRTIPTLLVISSASRPLPSPRRPAAHLPPRDDVGSRYKKTKIPEIKDRENYHRGLLFTKLNLVSNLECLRPRLAPHVFLESCAVLLGSLTAKRKNGRQNVVQERSERHSLTLFQSV